MIYLNMRRCCTKRRTSFGESMDYVSNTRYSPRSDDAPAKCLLFYGSQAWNFKKNIKYIITAWNRAIRKIWKLTCDSHIILMSFK